MHYFIDGYNLLFRIVPHSQNDLQYERRSIIQDLNKKISLLKLDVSIVFDANFQIGESSRSHYDQLEIFFTAEGETADDYILNEIKNSFYPQKETVVTSDKTLALRVRNRSAETQSVEEFMLWLNRSYKNKIHQLKKDKQKPPSSIAPLITVTKPSHPLTTPKNTSIEAYTDYYTQIFESKWQEMVKEEVVKEQETEKQKSLASSSSKRKKTSRKSKQSLAVSPSEGEESMTEMERWLKIFEKRTFDDKDKENL